MPTTRRGDSRDPTTTPPTVVVVMGVAGAGKTTVGRALARELGWPFHDADDHHDAANVARMRAGTPLTDADRAPWLSRLRVLIGDTLRAGGSGVLACSALRRVYRDALVPAEAAPGGAHGAVRFAYLRVGATALTERLERRSGHYMAPAMLASQLATLEEPEAGEGAVSLDGDQPIDEIVRELRARLVADRAGA